MERPSLAKELRGEALPCNQLRHGLRSRAVLHNPSKGLERNVDMDVNVGFDLVLVLGFDKEAIRAGRSSWACASPKSWISCLKSSWWNVKYDCKGKCECKCGNLVLGNLRAAETG